MDKHAYSGVEPAMTDADGNPVYKTPADNYLVYRDGRYHAYEPPPPEPERPSVGDLWAKQRWG